MGYESPAPACAVATRAEVSLSGPASCSCSSRARSSGAALPPLELRRAWHARGRWPPVEVGRAGARWQGMQAGGGAGRQAGRRLGAEERSAHLPLPTAAALPRGGWVWHGSRRRHSAESALNACQLLSTKIPSLAAMLAGPTHTGRACCEVLLPNTSWSACSRAGLRPRSVNRGAIASVKTELSMQNLCSVHALGVIASPAIFQHCSDGDRACRK
jgi:hypothetical protein